MMGGGESSFHYHQWLHYTFERRTLKYEWIAAVASLRILNRELKTLVLHLRWGNWRMYSKPCLSLILKGKSWDNNVKNLQLHFDQIHIEWRVIYTLEQKCDCFPYHRITFSNNTDCVCFQFNWLFLMGTLLQETSDFNSTTKREQPIFLRTIKSCQLCWGSLYI